MKRKPKCSGKVTRKVKGGWICAKKPRKSRSRSRSRSRSKSKAVSVTKTGRKSYRLKKTANRRCHKAGMSLRKVGSKRWGCRKSSGRSKKRGGSSIVRRLSTGKPVYRLKSAAKSHAGPRKTVRKVKGGYALVKK